MAAFSYATVPPSQPPAEAPSAAVGVALADTLRTSLASMGIVDRQTRDSLTEEVTSLLAEKGLVAEVASVHHGCLLLRCDARTWHLVRFERDRVLASLAVTHPGEVSALGWRPDRSRS